MVKKEKEVKLIKEKHKIKILLSIFLCLVIFVLAANIDRKYREELAKNDARNMLEKTLIYIVKNEITFDSAIAKTFDLGQIDPEKEINICPLNKQEYSRKIYNKEVSSYDSSIIIQLEDEMIDYSVHLDCGNYSVSLFLNSENKQEFRIDKK